MTESNLVNDVPRNAESAVCAYADWLTYRSVVPSKRFFEPHPIMDGFKGDMDFAPTVKDYLLSRVSLEERESVERRFQVLEEITNLANNFL